MDPVLDQFLREEATAFVRSLLLEAIADHGDCLVDEFNFNRFDLTIDFETERILLQDVLDAGASGKTTLAIADFVRHLETG